MCDLPEHCKFPFKWHNVWISKCQPSPTTGIKRKWCSTTRTFDRDKRWKWCTKHGEMRCSFSFCFLCINVVTMMCCNSVIFLTHETRIANSRHGSKLVILYEHWTQCTLSTYQRLTAQFSVHLYLQTTISHEFELN